MSVYEMRKFPCGANTVCFQLYTFKKEKMGDIYIATVYKCIQNG